MSDRPKKFQHPLQILFNNKRMDHTHGMNILQDAGLISDLCVTLEEVPWCDAMNVMSRVKATWAKMYFQ